MGRDARALPTRYTGKEHEKKAANARLKQAGEVSRSGEAGQQPANSDGQEEEEGGGGPCLFPCKRWAPYKDM